MHPFSTPWKHFSGAREMVDWERMGYNVLIQPISYHCSPSIPPENTKKPSGFLMFTGIIERDQLYEMSPNIQGWTK